MRWFRHDSYTFSNPKLRKLRKKYGFISYGFFFYLLEELSKYGEDCCLSLQKLTIEEMIEDTQLDEVVLRRMLGEMSYLNLIDKTRYDKDDVIFVPKFVEYFDDYSKRVRREVTVPLSSDTSVRVDKIREEKNREEEIISTWNQTKLPRILTFSQERRVHLKERLKNKHFVENLSAAITRISESQFCTGGADGRGWKATVDWLLANDTNYVKALEGKYDDRNDPEEIRKLFGLKSERK